MSAAPTSTAALPLRSWWWLPVVWILIGFLFSLQPLVWTGLSWHQFVSFEFARSWPWLLLAPFIVWLSLRWPLLGPRWGVALLVHVLACLLTAAALDFAWRELRRPEAGPFGPGNTFFHRERGEGERDRPPPPDFSRPGDDHGGRPEGRGAFLRPFPGFWTLRLRLTLPLYWSLVAAAHLLLFQARSRRAERTETLLAETRLAALQMQLQPHFLFNSLNAISSLVRRQPDVADEMICSLGALLRASLDNQGRREIPLREELALARHYLAIQRLRFGPKLQVVERVAGRVVEAAVPPLLLQPLLENAVTHGLSDQAGTVTVEAEAEGEELRLRVIDRPASPGISPRAAAGSGIGLSNSRARLDALYGPAASIALHVDATSHTTEVRMPLRRVDQTGRVG